MLVIYWEASAFLQGIRASAQASITLVARKQAGCRKRIGGLLGNMDEEHISYIGKRELWGGETPFGFTQRDRRNHLYLIGKTGVGKSTALRNLITQDIDAGLGVGVIDPHGDLA